MTKYVSLDKIYIIPRKVVQHIVHKDLEMFMAMERTRKRHEWSQERTTLLCFSTSQVVFDALSTRPDTFLPTHKRARSSQNTRLLAPASEKMIDTSLLKEDFSFQVLGASQGGILCSR
jgi:hypothetical protein